MSDIFQMELSPSPPGNSARKSAGIRFAKWCLWLPFVGFLAPSTLAVIAGSHDGGSTTWTIAGLTLAALVFSLGLSFGVCALRIAKVEGRKAIFGRAVTGLGFNIIFLVVTLVALGGSIYVATLLASQKRDEVADEKRTHELSLLRDRATGDFATKVNAMMRRYRDSAMALTNPPVLDFARVKNREELKNREAVVEEYLASCRGLQGLAENGPELYRKELERVQLPSRIIDASVKTFAKTFRSSAQSDPVVRKAEVRTGEAMLKILTFVDGEWDALTYDAAKQRYNFKNTTAEADYLRLSKEFNKAKEEFRDLELALPPKTGNSSVEIAPK